LTPAARGTRKGLVAALVIVASAASAYAVAVHTPPGPHTLADFEPDRLAELELDMWKAYYAKEKVRLFGLLATLLREQYRYTWTRAVRAAFHLARAAATFGDATGGYERVLPDLERAYAIARDWTGARYDPAAVARAELAWWVARREPGRNGAASVGALIADEYALVYEVPRERVLEAAQLRAEAARLRDVGGPRADWPEVGRRLRESYRSLQAAVVASSP
jgi:hypothetical protein